MPKHSAIIGISDHLGWAVLVTCWPFDAVTPGGPLRYVVTGARRRASAAGSG